ncbi:MAG: response regulator [Tepidisphaeraceae bacterium]
MILVVDDHPDTAELLVRLLRRSGLEAASAGRAHDALEYLRGDSRPLPSLIILDVTMPDMDGIACLRAIRAEPKWADVPVIMYTADFGLERMHEALRMGAVGYVVKGVMRWEDFLAIIHQHRRGIPGSA